MKSKINRGVSPTQRLFQVVSLTSPRLIGWSREGCPFSGGVQVIALIIFIAMQQTESHRLTSGCPGSLPLPREKFEKLLASWAT